MKNPFFSKAGFPACYFFEQAKSLSYSITAGTAVPLSCFFNVIQASRL